MHIVLELALCLVFIWLTYRLTKSLLLDFCKPNGSVFAFFGAIASATVAWLWVYLFGIVAVYGQFIQNSVGPGMTIVLFVLGFVSTCLACYVQFYKDMPKGPTR